MAKWWQSIIMFFLPAQCKRNKCNCNWFWLINSNTPAGRIVWRVTLWVAIDSETEELETIAQWIEILYGIHCIPQNNLFFGSLDSVWHADMLLCHCRGGCIRLLCFMSGHKMSKFVKHFWGKLNSALYCIYSGCLQRACSSRKCMFWIRVSCIW